MTINFDNRVIDTAAPGAAPTRRDSGTTIVEVLMAIVLVAIASILRAPQRAPRA